MSDNLVMHSRNSAKSPVLTHTHVTIFTCIHDVDDGESITIYKTV